MTTEEKQQLAKQIRRTAKELSALLSMARANKLRVILADGSSRGVFNNYESTPSVNGELHVYSITETTTY